MDKISLIYEFNNDSPLFARAAAVQISKRKFDEAIQILNGGIEKYPNYPTAHFLRGIALAYNEQFDDARQSIHRGARMIHSEKTLNFYLDKIESIAGKFKKEEEIRGASFVPEKLPDDSATDKIKADVTAEIDNNMVKLTNEIKRVKDFLRHSSITPPKEDSENSFNIHPKLVSETLANIFTQQKKYDEAIEVYRQLSEKAPEKSADFLKKIESLKAKISEQQ